MRTIDEELDEVARSHGFHSYYQLLEALKTRELERPQRESLAEDLTKVVGKSAVAQSAPVSAPLVPLLPFAADDPVKNAVDLIRVLLFGYTTQEIMAIQNMYLVSQKAGQESPRLHAERVQRFKSLLAGSPVSDRVKP